MPQAPTTTMLLIKPTELGDSGVWASLLDNMFDLIDSHDHSPSKGIQLKQTNIKIDADIPWSSGGTFWAIKDIRAIDFQPSTQASVSTLSGALFVDAANNELSYRTTGGSIIRFTNGANFNFSAIGGIGGDYSGVAALVDYVDASDFYRFRQQVGAGVQQYARVEVGGVDLFEFKANPAAGVPANRVRLSSPAALGASYEVTWPLALPATGSGWLHADSTGAITINHTLASLSPAAIGSGNTNNYNPAGWADAAFIRLDATAAVGPVVTGLAAGISGRVVTIHNISAVTIAFTNNDGSSTAANQILTPTGATINVAQNQCINLIYDATTAKWRVTSKNF